MDTRICRMTETGFCIGVFTNASQKIFIYKFKDNIYKKLVNIYN